jgi:hypothetical protein
MRQIEMRQIEMRWVILPILLCVAISLQASQDIAAEKAQVLRLLSGYEWQFSPEVFQSLSADTYLRLIDIARDDSMVAHMRGRAMVVLSLYKNDVVFNYFRETAIDDRRPSERRRAVEGLCEIFLDSEAESIKNSLSPMLKSVDVHLRIKVARCLAGIQRDYPDEKLADRLAAYRESIDESWELEAAGFQAATREQQ